VEKITARYAVVGLLVRGIKVLMEWRKEQSLFASCAGAYTITGSMTSIKGAVTPIQWS